jgi:hypothetical protein
MPGRWEPSFEGECRLTADSFAYATCVSSPAGRDPYASGGAAGANDPSAHESGSRGFDSVVHDESGLGLRVAAMRKSRSAAR